MTRTGALALFVLVSAGVGTYRLRQWPDARSALDCAVEAIGWEAGPSPFARCHGAGSLPADVARALGRQLDLNQAPEDALARLPGIGTRVAQALVAARSRAPFRDWAAVEAVRGVGPARLATLQRHTVLGP